MALQTSDRSSGRTESQKSKSVKGEKSHTESENIVSVCECYEAPAEGDARQRREGQQEVRHVEMRGALAKRRLFEYSFSYMHTKDAKCLTNIPNAENAKHNKTELSE